MLGTRHAARWGGENESAGIGSGAKKSGILQDGRSVRTTTHHHHIPYGHTISRWCHEACLLDLLARLCRVCVASDPRQRPPRRSAKKTDRALAFLVLAWDKRNCQQDKPKGELTGAAGKHLVESAVVVSAVMWEHLGTCAPPRSLNRRLRARMHDR